ncbi:MAG: ISAzo13 family transposase [Moorea sp. SIO3I7]|nr:ISAzo13 family transposase [Moorena sp. SIO3I7]
MDMSIIESLRIKFEALVPYMNEKLRRLWAASEAVALGENGIELVVFATGIGAKTVSEGIKELQQPLSSVATVAPSTRIRKPGGGRKSYEQSKPKLLKDLEELIDPITRGDPESPLRWTSKSTSKIAEALRKIGHQISPRTVAKLLHQLGYSLQSNRKSSEGKGHPDRDEQFQYINQEIKEYQGREQPVISVDTKKKELIGNYKNEGKEWERKKEPVKVKMHDFADPNLGKVIPYGIYDVSNNQGWVNVGIDHDTAEFAVQSIRTWWQKMGIELYPGAQELLITADAGGSNGYRLRLWKTELQKLADETGLKIKVVHFPPGTSKWNKIEHRMFCKITENWRGRPLISREVVVNLIANTTTQTGLTIHAELDQGKYQIGQRISDSQLSQVNLQPADFHGEWNYQIIPNLK